MNEKEARINLDFTLSRESRHEPSVVKRRATAVTLEHCCICSHSDRKRCLAIADINWWQANRYSAAEIVERIRGHFEEATQCSKLEEKYLKRYNKWLALAEEPTWAKFLQLIHKEAK